MLHGKHDIDMHARAHTHTHVDNKNGTQTSVVIWYSANFADVFHVCCMERVCVCILICNVFIYACHAELYQTYLNIFPYESNANADRELSFSMDECNSM